MKLSALAERFGLGSNRSKNELNQLLKEGLKLMATINERLAAIESSIDEAGTELTNELAKLREQLGNVITPEADATITRLEGKAKALAEIIPNEPPQT